ARRPAMARRCAARSRSAHRILLGELGFILAEAFADVGLAGHAQRLVDALRREFLALRLARAPIAGASALFLVLQVQLAVGLLVEMRAFHQAVSGSARARAACFSMIARWNA